MNIRPVCATLLITGCAVFSTAYADSIVIPQVAQSAQFVRPAQSAQPTKPAQSAQPAQPAKPIKSQAVKPLLVIRFNEKHVHYERMLKQAVAAVEKAKPGASYMVISAVPPIAPGSQLTNEADNNLISVVSAIEKLGVNASRIRSGTITGNAPTQEIDLYIQ